MKQHESELAVLLRKTLRPCPGKAKNFPLAYLYHCPTSIGASPLSNCSSILFWRRNFFSNFFNRMHGPVRVI